EAPPQLPRRSRLLPLAAGRGDPAVRDGLGHLPDPCRVRGQRPVVLPDQLHAAELRGRHHQRLRPVLPEYRCRDGGRRRDRPAAGAAAQLRDCAQPEQGGVVRLPLLPAGPCHSRPGGDRAGVLPDQCGGAVRQPDRRHPAHSGLRAAHLHAHPQRHDARHHRRAVRGHGHGRGEPCAGLFPAGPAAVQGRPLHHRRLLGAPGLERIPLPPDPHPVRGHPRGDPRPIQLPDPVRHQHSRPARRSDPLNGPRPARLPVRAPRTCPGPHGRWRKV
ncbi:MAG: ABC transporter, permease protein 2 (cluster 1, maltose/g3p/polyamine/iron), partial [uncultured Arthrobacter sp.]